MPDRKKIGRAFHQALAQNATRRPQAGKEPGVQPGLKREQKAAFSSPSQAAAPSRSHKNLAAGPQGAQGRGRGRQHLRQGLPGRTGPGQGKAAGSAGQAGQKRPVQVSPWKKRAVQHDFLIFICLLLPLIFLGLLFPFWPKEDVSSAENRALAQAPDLTWDNVFSGRFSQDFERYYSDQFPLRQGLLSLNRQVKQLIHLFPQKEGEGMQIITAKKDGGGQGTPDPGLSQPQAAANEEPTSLPGASDQAEAEGSPEQLEGPESNEKEGTKAEESQGPDPDREIKETAIKLHNDRETQYQTSQIVIAGGRAMELHYYSEEYTADYAKRINHFRSVLPEDRRLISMVVPTAIAFYGNEEYRSGSYSSFDAIKNIYEHEAPEIYKVDAYTELAGHLDEYIYFRTDHHWTGRGAYYAYEAFCKTLDLEAPPLDSLDRQLGQGTFLGSLYGYTDQSPLLVDSADQAEFFMPLHQADYNYYEGSSMENPISGTLLAYNVSADNQYILYLGGDVPLGHIQSELKNGRSILVVKDSFGNAFIPYLIDQYEDIYIVDPRSYTEPLADLVVEKEINDVLVMNYTFAVSNPDWLAGFEASIGYEEEE